MTCAARAGRCLSCFTSATCTPKAPPLDESACQDSEMARTHGCMVSRLAHLIYKTPSFSLAPDCLAAMQTCLCNPHSIASQAKLPRKVSVQAGTQAMYTSLIAMH